MSKEALSSSFFKSARFYPWVLLAVFFILAATSLIQKSATYDESYNLGVGYYLLTHGDRDIPAGGLHPPLSSIIHGLPLFLTEIPESIWKEPIAHIRGQKMIDLRGDDWMLNLSRLAVVFIGVALGWLVFSWSRRLYGAGGGLLSLTIYCFSPNILAHARLITPDMTLIFTTVLSVYWLWRFMEAPERRYLVAAGLSLGLLLYSKYTALLLIPILMLTDLACRYKSKGLTWRRPRRLLKEGRHWLALLGIGLFFLWAGYFFSTGFLVMDSGLKIPVFAVEYFQGAYFQWKQSRLPHDFFFLGDFSHDGWWYFYLVVMAIKIPIAISALFLCLVLGKRWLGLRFAPREMYLWLPAILYLFYLSFFNTIHNGIRYLLPVYPLILVLLGKYGEGWSRSFRVRLFVAVALTWLVGACLWIWPDFIAYHNEWIGGPKKAWLWTSDSNLDWGQDLKELKKYMDDKGIGRVQLAYFGTADPEHYGIAYDYLPSATSPLRRTPPGQKGSGRSNIMALSVYQYQGTGFRDKSIYKPLHQYVPNDTVGYSILIFDLKNLVPRKD